MSLTKTGLLLVALCCWIGWAGCSDDSKKTTEPPFEATYLGELHIDVQPTMVGREHTDTVRLAVSGERFTLIMLTNDATLCDLGGRVTNFGKNSAVFTPTDSMPANCDSIHVLRGEFPTIFRGDSLLMMKTDTLLETLFEFRLKQT